MNVRDAVATTSLLLAAVLAVVMVAVDDRGGPDHRLGDCQPTDDSGWSPARRWNEATLDAIRVDLPYPTVHARNLYHVSAAMWDAWAAYDPAVGGVFVDVEPPIEDGLDVELARTEAVSFAAYRVLEHRYLGSPGAEVSITGFDQLMEDLCLDRTFTGTSGPSPAAVGNRVATEILAATADDGANEAGGYVDPDYQPVNAPLVVAESGATLVDPNRWQPLELRAMVSQTGIPLTETVQTFVGSQWGRVTPFALPADPDDGLPLDPGPPPRLGEAATDGEFKAAVVEVIAHSARLDPGSGSTVDIGPSTTGNAPLGTYDEQGHAVNPANGLPYEPNLVVEGDHGRVIAEYWADGPSSETPPGHWNVVANTASDALGPELVIGGRGPAVDRFEWDVKLFLALNGAMHDAAVAAWGAKAHYDYVRPISMIRWMGGRGQSTDPDSPAFDPAGLPLEPGLIEVVTEASSRPGARHEHLADHRGEVAIRSWQGVPTDPEADVAGVGWIRAVDWVPYQLPTFVTPAFAGYVSGHSTFSRAGAEVLTAITGDPYFPGGLGEWVVPAGSLEFEAGPVTDVRLQWATYADAADEAGRSRLFGGIHVRADDLRGREMGAEIGQMAWAEAQSVFGDPDG